MEKSDAIRILMALAVCGSDTLTCVEDCPYYSNERECDVITKDNIHDAVKSMER